MQKFDAVKNAKSPKATIFLVSFFIFSISAPHK